MRHWLGKGLLDENSNTHNKQTTKQVSRQTSKNQPGFTGGYHVGSNHYACIVWIDAFYNVAGGASVLDHLEYCSCNTIAISDLGWFVIMGHRFLGFPVFLGVFRDIALV